MDLVNFQVGAKTVALPILNILLTERFDNDLTEMPNENPSFIGVKDFMNLPIPVFDLGKILNHNSTKVANKALANQLSQLQDDVMSWMTGLDHSAQQKSALPASVQHTSYAKWLADFQSDNEDLVSLLNQVTGPMNTTYQCLEQLKANGCDISLWRRTFESNHNHLTRLFQSVIEQVETGYKPIIVFTTTDGRAPHVGLLVDKVEDSIHVDESDIKSLDTVTNVGFELDSKTKSLMQGLIQLEQKHSIIIDPSVLFQEQQHEM